MKEILFNLCFSFLGAFAFAIIFNVKRRNLLIASLGGMLGWSVYVFSSGLLGEEILRYFIASMVISLYAKRMATWKKTPVLIYLVIAFIPLVPGYSIYKAMEYLLISDTQLFIEHAVHTFKVVMAIATGFLVTSKVIGTISIEKLHKGNL